MNALRVGILLASLVWASSSHADIYKWYDENGVANYSGKAPLGVETQRLRYAGKAATSTAEATILAAGIRRFLEQSSRDKLRRTRQAASRSAIIPRANVNATTYNENRKQNRNTIQSVSQQKQFYRQRSGSRNSMNRINLRAKLPPTLAQKKAERARLLKLNRL
ncbi:MAG: DUF4124 domain-containing protein [Halopseudomonas sp.]